MTYKTEITIWSKIGNTPKTGRNGAFCDVLLQTVIDCENPADAKAATKRLIAETPHGFTGHFHMQDHPNQNTNQMFL